MSARRALSRAHVPSLRTGVAASAALALSASIVLLGAGTSRADSPHGADKVSLCHATNASDNANNQYNLITVYDDSTKLEGHLGHDGPIWYPGAKADGVSWGDIIPPVDYVVKGKGKAQDVVVHFPGLNWTAEGRAILANNCVIPTDTTSTEPAPEETTSTEPTPEETTSTEPAPEETTSTEPAPEETTTSSEATPTETPGAAHLHIVKSVNTVAYEAGQQVTFTYVVSNDGTAPVYDVQIGEPAYADDADESNTLSDSLVAPLNDPNFALTGIDGEGLYFTGTGELGARVPLDAAKAQLLEPGQSVTFTAPYVTTEADAIAGHITNTAYAFGDPAEGDYVASGLSDAALASVAGEVATEEPPVVSPAVESSTTTSRGASVDPVVTSVAPVTTHTASVGAHVVQAAPLASTGASTDIGRTLAVAFAALAGGLLMLLLGRRPRTRRTH